ncbi:TrgA family protein [Jannaschia sp. W003]|uniref:TrgA family protein n=1 Tax=Jannaschia sp. W003 TaxID=2867012 RepID=UPI0021A6C0FF|nr:TrgA family protein [Jannaschia sp. W003]UWQ20312.1 TrgA family protein [Jannaschia sp. W003]
MPTPAKLVAAVAMAIIAWLTAEAVHRYALPEGVSIGRGREILAAMGLVMGWRMIGRQATGIRGRGDRLVNGLTMGLACALSLAVLAVFLHAFYVMILESMDLAYNSPGKAFSGWMGFVMRDAAIAWNPYVLVMLFGGGAVAGLLSGVAGRVWR